MCSLSYIILLKTKYLLLKNFLCCQITIKKLHKTILNPKNLSNINNKIQDSKLGIMILY
jgi:hypothetical protein